MTCDGYSLTNSFSLPGASIAHYYGKGPSAPIEAYLVNPFRFHCFGKAVITRPYINWFSHSVSPTVMMNCPVRLSLMVTVGAAKYLSLMPR